MLTTIEIENFKGIGSPVRIELRPITLLFGPNSAGKSTILHALHYAHEILSHRNLNPDQTHHGGDSIDLGGFQTFVHGQNLDRAIRLGFELDLKEKELPNVRQRMQEDRPFHPPSAGHDLNLFNSDLDFHLETAFVEIVVQWSSARHRPVVRSYSVAVNGISFAQIEASPDGASVELCGVNFKNPNYTADERVDADFLFATDPLTVDPDAKYQEVRLGIRNLDRSALPVWGEMLEFDYDVGGDEPVSNWPFEPYPLDAFVSRTSVVLAGIGEILRDEVSNLRYIGPMRDVLPRTYSSPRFEDSSRWASGIGAWDLMSTRGSDFVKHVSEWLAKPEHLDTGYGVKLKSFLQLPTDGALWLSIKQGSFLDIWDDIEAEFLALETKSEFRLIDASSGMFVRPSDVGVGVSQVIPVVVAALDPNRAGITAIEQPELHIHPRVQVGLGDLFAGQIKQRSGCFLLETHSEHLMLRLLRRIEETSSEELPDGKPSLEPDDVSVIFVEQIDGEVKATPLRIDTTGEFIDRWPHGFFEERVDELI